MCICRIFSKMERIQFLLVKHFERLIHVPRISEKYLKNFKKKEQLVCHRSKLEQKLVCDRILRDPWFSKFCRFQGHLLCAWPFFWFWFSRSHPVASEFVLIEFPIKTNQWIKHNPRYYWMWCEQRVSERVAFTLHITKRSFFLGLFSAPNAPKFEASA